MSGKRRGRKKIDERQGEILRNILAAMKQAAIGIDRKWNTWKVMDDDLDGLPTVTGKRA